MKELAFAVAGFSNPSRCMSSVYFFSRLFGSRKYYKLSN
jgi:hypothetical protein